MVAGRSVNELCIAVINLVNAARLCKTDIERAALDLARPRRRCVPTLKVLPVQRIVLEQVLIAIICRRLDIVGDTLRLIGIRRPRRIVCFREMRALIGINRKVDLVRIRTDHTCTETCVRTQLPVGRNRVVAGTVIDLRRMGGVPMRIDDIEVVRINCLAVDRPLAVDGLVHRIIARCRRTKRIPKRLIHLRIANVMRRAVARVCVVSESTACAVAIAARCRSTRTLIIPRSLQCACRDTVPTEDRSDDRGLRCIRDPCDIAIRIGRCTVIGLRHIAHLDIQLARVDRACICDRAEIRRDGLRCTRAGGRRTDDSIALIDNLIIVRILTRELRRIGDRLLDDIAAAVAGNIPGRIECRRGVVACLSAHPPREGDDRVALDLSAISVRMLPHPVVDLRDLFRRRPN